MLRRKGRFLSSDANSDAFHNPFEESCLTGWLVGSENAARSVGCRRFCRVPYHRSAPNDGRRQQTPSRTPQDTAAKPKSVSPWNTLSSQSSTNAISHHGKGSEIINCGHSLDRSPPSPFPRTLPSHSLHFLAHPPSTAKRRNNPTFRRSNKKLAFALPDRLASRARSKLIQDRRLTALASSSASETEQWCKSHRYAPFAFLTKPSPCLPSSKDPQGSPRPLPPPTRKGNDARQGSPAVPRSHGSDCSGG